MEEVSHGVVVDDVDKKESASTGKGRRSKRFGAPRKYLHPEMGPAST
jgi:hypothetical protein